MRCSPVRFSPRTRPRRTSGVLTAAMLLLVCSVPAAAVRHLNVSADSIEFGKVVARGVDVHIGPEATPGALFELTAASVSMGEDLSLDDVRVRCTEGALEARTVQCAHGSLSASLNGERTVTARASFFYELGGRRAEMSVESEQPGPDALKAQIKFEDAHWSAELHARAMPLEAVHALSIAAGLAPGEYSGVSGTFDVDVWARGGADTPLHAEGEVRLHDAGFLGPDSAEHLTAGATFRIDLGEQWQVFFNGSLEKGLVYVEPGLEMNGFRPGVALEAPAAGPISILVDAGWTPAARRLRLQMLDITHPGTGALRLRADVIRGEQPDIRSLDATLTQGDAGRLYTTWLQPFLIGTRFGALEAAGRVDAGVSIRDNELRSLTVGLRDVHTYDSNNRFYIAGLDGDLRVHGGPDAVDSTLRWAGLGVYKLQFGAGEIDLTSSNADVRVTRWVDLPLLDGSVKIDSLSVTKAGRKDMRVELDGSITPVSMANLTQQIGWPVMSGTLSGRIAGFSYQYGRLQVDGSIDIDLFDGQVTVSNLSVDDLFGLVPELHADVRLDGIDLALLTDRFSFGSIEGTLDGYVNGLELQAWQPVYFDAKLQTPEDDDRPHRISQRAVDNLGYLGGGATSALSSGFLKFLPSYSYGRLGVGCRLYNGACEMSGVAATPGGFLILTRGGALPPWIEVKGTGKSIEWNTLIEGLKSIASNPAQIR